MKIKSLNLLVFFFKFYTGPLQYHRKPLRFLSSEHRYPKTCVTYDATYVTHVKEKKKSGSEMAADKRLAEQQKQTTAACKHQTKS